MQEGREQREEEEEEDEEEAARHNAFLHHLLAAMVNRQRSNDTNDEARGPDLLFGVDGERHHD